VAILPGKIERKNMKVKLSTLAALALIAGLSAIAPRATADGGADYGRGPETDPIAMAALAGASNAMTIGTATINNATIRTNATLSALTASKVVFSDGSKVLTSTAPAGVQKLALTNATVGGAALSGVSLVVTNATVGGAALSGVSLVLTNATVGGAAFSGVSLVVTNITAQYSGTLYDSTGAALTNAAGVEVSIITNYVLETGTPAVSSPTIALETGTPAVSSPTIALETGTPAVSSPSISLSTGTFLIP
jgi:hypothetical protein